MEMEIRFGAEQVWINTNDKRKILGYWVPCAKARALMAN